MSLYKKFRRGILKRFAPGARQARMGEFIRILDVQPGARILDLGGTTKLWRFVDTPLNITVLNLDSQRIDELQYGAHRFTIVRGDATDVSEYSDNSFDIVFSNSCIEHVGPEEKQAAFAREVRRLAPRYWIQTPSITFPLEAHTGLPFWWAYPKALREALVKRWIRRTPGFGRFIHGTRVLKLEVLQSLFPDGQLVKEKVLGFTKSNTLWR